MLEPNLRETRAGQLVDCAGEGNADHWLPKPTGLVASSNWPRFHLWKSVELLALPVVRMPHRLDTNLELFPPATVRELPET